MVVGLAEALGWGRGSWGRPLAAAGTPGDAFSRHGPRHRERSPPAPAGSANGAVTFEEQRWRRPQCRLFLKPFLGVKLCLNKRLGREDTAESQKVKTGFHVVWVFFSGGRPRRPLLPAPGVGGPEAARWVRPASWASRLALDSAAACRRQLPSLRVPDAQRNHLRAFRDVVGAAKSPSTCWGFAGRARCFRAGARGIPRGSCGWVHGGPLWLQRPGRDGASQEQGTHPWDLGQKLSPRGPDGMVCPLSRPCPSRLSPPLSIPSSCWKPFADCYLTENPHYSAGTPALRGPVYVPGRSFAWEPPCPALFPHLEALWARLLHALLLHSATKEGRL